MSNPTIQLPEPDEDLQGKEIAPGVYERGYRKDQLRAHAAAVSAAKDAEIDRLSDRNHMLLSEQSKALADNAALRAELAQAMKERARAIAGGDNMEQEVEQLRERIKVLRNALSECYGALPTDTDGDFLREIRAALGDKT